MKWNKCLAAILAAACALGVTACGSGSTQSGAQGSSGAATSATASAFPGTADPDMVVIDITSEPAELNPMLMTEAISVDLLRHSMAGLARLDKNDNAVPDLAERWENNADNTSTTVYLRKDAKWSNGDPVTANDYFFSWTNQLNPDTGSVYAVFLYDKIKNGKAYYEGTVELQELGLKVVDDYTLQIDWERPMASVGFIFTLPCYFPMNQKAYEEIGVQQYAKDADKMLSNGPYKITEWVHDDHILMEKNPDYHGAASIKIPKVKFVMIGDTNTSLNAFLAGELDMCNVYAEDISLVQSQDANAVASYIDGGSWYLNFNMKNRFLSNVNLRKALAYAVDVQGLLDNVIKDGSVAADGFVPDVIAGANGTRYAETRGSLFAYNPDAAKTYLEKALTELGVAAGEIKLELIANDSTYSQTQAAYLQQQWKEKLGLDVGIRVLAWKARVEAQQTSDYDMFVEGWGPSENDAMTFLEIYQSNYPTNYTGYSSEAYDAAIAAAVTEGDPAKRQEFLLAAEKQLMDDMAIGPMYFTCTTYAISGKLRGMVRTPFQLFNVCDGAEIAS